MKIKSIVMCAFASFTSPVMALTETVDGIEWTYDVSEGVARIYGTYSRRQLDAWNYRYVYTPAISPSNVKIIEVPERLGGSQVVEIGEYAFYNCSALKSVSIPDSVTSIGNHAFYNCSGLTSVSIPDSVTSIGSSAFNDCRGLASIIIPNSVTNIGAYAFVYCTNLTSVAIPDSVTTISSNMFYNCSGLTSVFIPNSVTSICYQAFFNCSGLTSISMPNSVTRISDQAFSGCSGLTNMTIPDSVAYIGYGAFNGCKGLTSMTIPNSVTRIEISAFQNCTNVTSVTIPQYVCTNQLSNILPSYGNITNVVISSNTSWIRSNAFLGCTNLTSVIIPDSVTYIYDNAFNGCHRLVSVSIPQYVCTSQLSKIFPSSYRDIMNVTISSNATSIGNFAFSGCTNLTSLAIPDSVTRIGSYAFQYCSNLTSVTIGSNVTNIGYLAFKDFVGAISVAEEIGRVVFGANVCDADVYPLLPEKDGIDYVWIDDEGNDVADPFHSKTTIAATPYWRVKKIAGLSGDAVFPNTSQEVELSCGTPGATIYYTTDGSDPAVEGLEYKRPFAVYKSCTVRAVAVKDDYRNSPEVTATFTRAEGLSEAANLLGYTMESDAAAPWTVDTEMSHDGVSSVRSGAIGNGGETTLTVSLRRAGTVSFWWRVQCEEAEVDGGETYYYDYGSFIVDGNEVAQIAGNDTGWRRVEYMIASGGKHVLQWKYSKDGATTYHPDCIWVDRVQWTPADGSGQTMTTPYPVPYSWIDKYRLASGTDYETAGNAFSGKTDGGRPTTVWEEYVAGLDPTNAASRLVAGIEMTDGGPVVTWSPNLNTNGVNRIYKVYGSETLEGGGTWEWPTNSLHRFFKVTVEMP